MNDITKLRWSTVDPVAANHLTLATNSHGVIYPIASTALPQQLQKMVGVSSYYVSGYLTPQTISSGLTIGGEMVVARSDGALTKNYNYVFASSIDGTVCFAGPFKGFGHHVSSGQSVEVNSLFGQHPFKK
jgi:hypothetical protein